MNRIPWGRLVALVLGAALLCGCRTIRPPHGSIPQERTLITTGYCSCGKCCGWRRTWYGKPVYSSGPKKGQRKAVGATASGKRASRGTIAADTAVYPFNTVMLVPGYGYGIVEDRGGAIKGDHVDLFFPAHRMALEWGRRTKRVKIWVPPGKKRAASGPRARRESP